MKNAEQDTPAGLVKTNSRKLSVISRPQKCLRCPQSEEMRRIGHTIFRAVQCWGSPSRRIPIFSTNKSTEVGDVKLRHALPGHQLITWMCQLTTEASKCAPSRASALSAWQVLVEEGVLLSMVAGNAEMCDSEDLYYFHDDICIRTCHSNQARDKDQKEIDDEVTSANLEEIVCHLTDRSADAMFRMILQKPCRMRTAEEVELVYNELVHLKALARLSTMVLRQLTQVLMFEAHMRKGEALFNQGDEGSSWYIIVRGAVQIHIHGKGVVTTLREGDDFGELALVNNSPRAASAILHEDNCHLLRVDKADFNLIIRDVEANTVRLQEHGEYVLVLGKTIQQETEIANNHGKSNDLSNQTKSTTVASGAYSIIAGKPEKMLEYIIDSCIEIPTNYTDTTASVILEDFILTYPIFMSNAAICKSLKTVFESVTLASTSVVNQDVSDSQSSDKTKSVTTAINKKRRVIYFLVHWARLMPRQLAENIEAKELIEDIFTLLMECSKTHPALQTDINILQILMKIFETEQRPTHKRISNRSRLSKVQSSKSIIPLERSSSNDPAYRGCVAQETHPVYFRDHAYRMAKLPLNSSVSELLNIMKKTLELPEKDFLLVEVKSDGDKVIFKPQDFAVTTSLSVNGRLFLATKEELVQLTPLSSQIPACDSYVDTLVTLTPTDLAHLLTQVDLELLQSICVLELLYNVLGRRKFFKSTLNLDQMIYQFSSLQHWVQTQILLVHHLTKRVTLLKRFIKTSQCLLDMGNFNSFFAIMMGLCNSSISRLYQTWDKLPSKYNKQFEHLCTILDPSRNHRALRKYLQLDQLQPPVIPFLGLLLKDITFAHEGNQTVAEHELVNFEKMQLIGRTLRLFLRCSGAALQSPVVNGAITRQVSGASTGKQGNRSISVSTATGCGIDLSGSGKSSSASSPRGTLRSSTSLQSHGPGSGSNSASSIVNGPQGIEIKNYFRQLKCVDTQKILTAMSHALESPAR